MQKVYTKRLSKAVCIHFFIFRVRICLFYNGSRAVSAIALYRFTRSLRSYIRLYEINRRVHALPVHYLGCADADLALQPFVALVACPETHSTFEIVFVR